jgi:pyruvate/2-oxoglutarate/acetoin dehydrogenase E1 component
MERLNVADTIREITRTHCEEKNGMIMGQAISAVGWVNNTVPDCKNLVELPMTDVAGAGFAAGAALVGRRPFFVVRFQDFLILNGSPLIFYAAKSKELHGKPCPVFIRAIAAEGIGPVHSGVLHSVFMHFPGFRVCAPMTPKEYHEAYELFMANDDPMMVSEHRISYKSCDEFEDVVRDDADITLYAISSTRFEVTEAAERLEREKGIRCNIIHLMWLKPFSPESRLTDPLKNTGKGLVLDAGHTICGAGQAIAYELTQGTGIPVRALGTEDKTKCLAKSLQNPAPNADKIYEVVSNMMA